MKKSFFGRFRWMSKVLFVLGCLFLAGAFALLVIGPFLPSGADVSPLAIMLLISGVFAGGMAFAIDRIGAIEEFGCFSWLAFLSGTFFVYGGLLFLLAFQDMSPESGEMNIASLFMIGMGILGIILAFVGKHWRVR